MGRPTDFNDMIADAICELIADGKSLRSICEADDMPNKATVFRWLAAHKSFSDQYARAREAQGDAYFDESLDIADDARNDWMKVNGEDDIGWKANGEHIQRSKLRVDTRKWAASKLNPKKYGEKLDMNLTASVENISEEKIDARIAELLRKAGTRLPVAGEGSEEGEE